MPAKAVMNALSQRCSSVKFLPVWVSEATEAVKLLADNRQVARLARCVVVCGGWGAVGVLEGRWEFSASIRLVSLPKTFD